MADFYEIDFLPVHTAKSGDAVAIRYEVGGYWWVHVVDGGYASTAPDLSARIRKYYDTEHIHRVVVTHPDQDHAEGLAPILEDFRVDELWMLRPWIYANQLVPHFARYNSAQALSDRLRKDYPYIEALEKIALRKNIKMCEPFQGAKIERDQRRTLRLWWYCTSYRGFAHARIRSHRRVSHRGLA